MQDKDLMILWFLLPNHKVFPSYQLLIYFSILINISLELYTYYLRLVSIK
jgi:hypothetical protein